MRPLNYRENKFTFLNQQITVAGMAGPHNNINPKGAMQYLKNTAKRSVLIGLHEDDFSDLFNGSGIEYHHLPIDDFSFEPISPIKYDEIFNIIQNSNTQNKLVTIHCGSGNGRTGTALAALKLREIIIDNIKKNPGILLNIKPAINKSISVCMKNKPIKCTERVKAAIEEIRSNKINCHAENGTDSVETRNDVNSLILYERWVILKCKQGLELKDKAQNREILCKIADHIFNNDIDVINVFLDSMLFAKDDNFDKISDEMLKSIFTIIRTESGLLRNKYGNTNTWIECQNYCLKAMVTHLKKIANDNDSAKLVQYSECIKKLENLIPISVKHTSRLFKHTQDFEQFKKDLHQISDVINKEDIKSCHSTN